MFANYADQLRRLVAALEHDRREGGELVSVEDIAAEWDDREPTAEADAATRFRDVVAAVEAEWGAAEFLEARDWRQLRPTHAIEAATWLRGDRRDVVAAVWYEQQDADLPVVLALGAFDHGWLLSQA